MRRREIEKYWKKNQALLHRLAYQCAARSGRNQEDVYGQACYFFMGATTSFNKNRGASFRTYLWRYVYTHLIGWSVRNDLPPDPENCQELVCQEFMQPDRMLEAKEWLASLSDECKFVAAIILNGPGELLDVVAGVDSPLTVRVKLQQYLRESGWSFPKIWNTMKTMKKEVKKL